MKKIVPLLFLSVILILWAFWGEKKSHDNLALVVKKTNMQDTVPEFWKGKTHYWIVDTRRRPSKCNHYTNTEIRMYPSLDTCDNNRCPFILKGEYWLETDESCLSFPNVDYVGKYFEPSDISVYCDFVSIKGSAQEKNSGFFILGGTGICPVSYKSIIHLDDAEKDERSLGMFLISSRINSSYHIEFVSMKPHKATEKASSSPEETTVFHSIPESLYPLFLISNCDESLCSVSVFRKKKQVRPKYFSPMLNEWNGHNIISKCSFITIEKPSLEDENRGDSRTTTAVLHLTGEGLCPIEMRLDKEERKIVYVKSVRRGNDYVALLTNDIPPANHSRR